MVRSLQIESKTLYQQKDYQWLYCHTHFLAVVLNRTHSISKASLSTLKLLDQVPLFLIMKGGMSYLRQLLKP